LIVAIRMLVSPLVTAIYPHMSHMAVASREDAVTFLRKYGFVMAAPFLLASAVLFFGAAPIIHLVYSAKYHPAVPLLRIMALAPFLLAVQHVYSTFYMLAFGYEKEWSRVILQTAVLNFVILIPLIYLIWPPQAVSITNIVLDLFVAAVTYLFFRRHTAKIPQAAAA
jgi:PST family polysaccharide transporter